MHLVSTGEFCRVFRVTRRTVYNWRDKGKLTLVLVPTENSERYMCDIHQYCLDQGISWKKVKDVLELKCSPETIS